MPRSERLAYSALLRPCVQVCSCVCAGWEPCWLWLSLSCHEVCTWPRLRAWECCWWQAHLVLSFFPANNRHSLVTTEVLHPFEVASNLPEFPVTFPDGESWHGWLGPSISFSVFWYQKVAACRWVCCWVQVFFDDSLSLSMFHLCP